MLLQAGMMLTAQELINENVERIAACDANLARLEDDIRDKRAEIAAGRSAALQKADEEFKVATKTKSTLTKLLIEADSGEDKLQREVEAAEANLQKADDKLHQASDEKARLKKDVDDCRAQSKDRLAAFGRNVDLVIAAIDREQWTGRKPVGPMGRFVTLLDGRESMRRLFTHILGSLMCGFAVQNEADRNKLSRLISQESR